MARTAITPVTPVGPYPASVAANALDVAFTTGDATNDNSVAIGRRALVLMTNTDASAHTVTIASAADEYGRTGDITDYSIGAGEFAAFLIEPKGWRQTDGTVHIDPDTTDIDILVFDLPG